MLSYFIFDVGKVLSLKDLMWFSTSLLKSQTKGATIILSEKVIVFEDTPRGCILIGKKHWR